MNPALIIFGINAAIRLGRAGAQAYAQYVRDKPGLFPELERAEFHRVAFVNGFFADPDRLHTWVQGPDAPYREYWTSHGVDPTHTTAVDVLFAAAVKIKADEGVDLNQALQSRAEGTAGVVLVEQWDPQKGPVSPFARVILTAVDIALEFVAVNPSVLDLGGTGEKMLAAFARNLSDLLPSSGDFGPREHFAERLLGVFLRAGLKTLHEHPDWVVSEDHLEELIRATVPPILQELPDSITEQIKYREVVDTLIGPAASAALATIAKQPGAFLGTEFSPQTAIGALTRALLKQAAEIGVTAPFSREGLLEVYHAALGVAAERPHLFLQGSTPVDQLARDLFARVAGVLQAARPPFDGALPLHLMTAALEAVRANAVQFAAASPPWEQGVVDLVQEVIAALTAALADGGGAVVDRLFSKSQLVELGRIFLQQLATTPAMRTGRREEMQVVVRAVTQAMLTDTHVLLTADDWLEIARVAAAEGARNPARLFGLDHNNPTAALAADVLQVLLRAASQGLAEPEGAKRTVLFGATLREAITLLLRSVAGRPRLVQTRLPDIERLAVQVSTFVAEHKDTCGKNEWMLMFRSLLADLLQGKALPLLTRDVAEALIAGGRP